MSLQTTSPNDSLLRLPTVEARVGLKKSKIHKLMRDGRFPKSIKMGPNTTVWLSSAIDKWIAEQVRVAQEVSA